MTTLPSQLPVVGGALRFAPAVGLQPASNFWKIWKQGSEVYLACRTPSGNHHFSVHQSGQVHYRLATKQKQDLAPLMRLTSGPWTHAIEVRFLLSANTLPPLKPLDRLGSKKAHVVPVPEGFVFYANLLVSDAAVALDCALPAEFLPAAQSLWRVRLQDGRLAVLIGRLLAVSEENRQHIRRIREEIKPTVTFSSMPSDGKRVEVHHLHWSAQGGNVVLVVPMGEEAFRSDDEPIASNEQCEPRSFTLEAERSEFAIRAPDGNPVVFVQLDGINNSIEIFKGRPLRAVVGHLHLSLLVPNLLLGSGFIANPCRLPHAIKVGAISPRDWSYLIAASFDGATMTIELSRLATALRNENLTKTSHGLADREELMLVVPDEALKFTLTAQEPQASCELIGKFRLRDQTV